MTESRQTRVFDLLEEAASKGLRCPTNPDIAAYLSERGFRTAASAVPAIVRLLTREGRLTVRVYGNNWRDVTICSGPHAGKTSIPPPHRANPYLVIDST